MAHRDIPVVFHHINFTPVLPLFQKCDKMETGRGDEGDSEGEEETTSLRVHKDGNVHLLRVIAVIAVS